MKLSPALFAALLFLTPPLRAEIPDAPRLGPLKDLNGYFPFSPSPTPEAWAVRAEQVRMQMRVALGVWPEPTRTPLNAVVHGRIERGDYTVEKVYFESMPGFFVTGNLYRPAGKNARDEKHPGVLCPHGHWNDGRFLDSGEAAAAKEIASGAEQFAEGGRSVLQARCVQLARMGCVVFHYDMLGYADSTQLSMKLTHGFAQQRPEMSTRENWGLFSPQAEAHAQSMMGLQTWNGIRALDFLTALPDVDARRIGVTGASGGGTQTMILAALDPRVTVAFPAVMVSTAMQGGCTCENASGLRVGTGNVEFAALFAPKPMAMTAANDWTKEMETKGFPELQKHWAMLGAPQNVQLTALIQFPHNFNAPCRAAMSGWFNRHFALGLSDAQLAERDYTRLTRDEMTVWDAAHPAPAGAEEFEKKLLRWWHDDAQAQMAKSPEAFEKIARPAWRALIGPVVADVPAERLVPKKPSGRTVLWLGDLYLNEKTLRPEVEPLLAAGCVVLGINSHWNEVANRTVANPREAPAYTYGYNYAVFAQRVQDVLSALRAARAEEPHAVLTIFATGKISGPIAAAALAVDPRAADAAVIETRGFRFGDVPDYRDVNFLPAAAKYGDLPGALALAAPCPLYVIGENAPALAEAAYRSAGAKKKLTLAPKDAPLSAAVDWLLGQSAKKP